ncbi:hypothetical protein [Frondihabitans australicus]|uniref:Shikimate dehydrogenase (NADP(+)) n=1 Tax=Frondihabitans australicus TaxID=386892 RepID=A0A495IL32_9MICO|nr:hypothetical protein [Frondihabitans australicus]RKR76479.1 shikimate dehydrogenase [Frondihabitans australicus]
MRIDGATELLGLIATPIRHSRSPRMHDLALEHLGLPYVYLAFEVGAQELADAVSGLRALGARGFNVSMPNKVAVLDLLDDVDEAARLIGACNTVVNHDGVLTGYNTDGLGWTAALRENGVSVTGATVTIIGAGGASSAMVTQAALEGAARVRVVNRRDGFFDAALALASRVTAATGVPVTVGDLDDADGFVSAVGESSILANATGVGMKPLEGLSPLPVPAVDVLRPSLFVSDVVYEPAASALLLDARAAGCRTMNGLPMMLHQGAASFELFTGHAMPLDHVRAHLFG